MNDPVGKEINELRRDMRRFLYYHLDKYSLGDSQFEILIEVYNEKGISQEQLSKIRKVDKAATTNAVKRLMENDYIYRERDPVDKRAYKLYCTKKGIDFIPKLKEILKLEDFIVNKGISLDEMKIFRTVLKKIGSNIDNYFKEEKLIK
jgi:DNA-binding MarR family transcriptional regulator